MSWDIFAQDFPDVASIEDIPDDFRPRTLGSRDALIAKIVAAIPVADFSDPSWGLIEQGGWSIEVNIGDADECDSFALHVRGGGPGAVEAVSEILGATGVRAIDAQTGEFFDEAAARESFAQWQDYRDQIVGKISEEGGPEQRSPRRGFFSRLFGR